MKQIHKSITIVLAVCATMASLRSEAKVSTDYPEFKYSYNQQIDYPLWAKIIPNPAHKEMKDLQIDALYDFDYFRTDWFIVEKIGANAFSESHIERALISPFVRMICDGAFRKSALKEIEFGTRGYGWGVRYVGNYAFAGCRLSEVALPESVVIIRSSAFRDIATLQDVTLPSTLKCMGGFTFCGDASLKRIICHAPTPPAADDTDFGFLPASGSRAEENATGPDPDRCVIYVPEASIGLYSQASGWNRFKNIVSLESAGIESAAADDAAGKCRIEKGAISIECEAGDIIRIYDIGGNLLESRIVKGACTLRHEGTGLRIILVNDKVCKAML